MKFFIRVILVFCVVTAVSSCKKEKQETGELILLTYNVAGLPQTISSSNPELYTSLISPLLNSFDIVHVQEDFCYHDSLLLYNKHPYKTEPNAVCVPGSDGLNTFSYYPISGLYREAWTSCTGADCYTPKGFSYSQIDINGVKVDFYNVHCNAGSSEESKKARRGNIRQLTDYIVNHSSGRAAVVMGDFNSRYTRDGDTIKALLDLGFTDAWIQLTRHGEIPQYGTASLTNCEPLETAADCEGVDKIFYRSNSEIEFILMEYKHGDDERFLYQGIDSLHLSDHVPTYCKVKYIIK